MQDLMILPKITINCQQTFILFINISLKKAFKKKAIVEISIFFVSTLVHQYTNNPEDTSISCSILVYLYTCNSRHNSVPYQYMNIPITLKITIFYVNILVYWYTSNSRNNSISC